MTTYDSTTSTYDLPARAVAQPPGVKAPGVHRPAVVAAGSGLLVGILTVFLPLVQALPTHVGSGTVSATSFAGMGMVIAAVTGFLVHHGVITAKQAAAATPVINTVDSQPIVMRGVADLEREVERLKADLERAIGIHPQPSAPNPAPAQSGVVSP